MGRISASLKRLTEYDKEDIWVYVAALVLVGLVNISYGETLTRGLFFLFACQMLHKGYRWIKPKKLKRTLDLRQNTHMKIARQKRSDQVKNDRFGSKH